MNATGESFSTYILIGCILVSNTFLSGFGLYELVGEIPSGIFGDVFTKGKDKLDEGRKNR